MSTDVPRRLRLPLKKQAATSETSLTFIFLVAPLLPTSDIDPLDQPKSITLKVREVKAAPKIGS